MSDAPDLVATLRECPAVTRCPALLSDAIRDPDDTGVRRAIANALRAEGVDWGELVELQIAWHELPRHARDRTRRDNLVRQVAILRGYPELLRAVAGSASTCGRLSMGRGLVEHTTLDAATLLEHADELYRLAPLSSLELFPMDTAQAVALACLAQLATLRRLRLSSPAIGDAGVAALASSPHLASVTSLELYDAGVGDATLHHLASAAAFLALRRLTLSNARISHGAIDALVRSDKLATLRDLYLEGRSIDDKALRALARSALRLERLSLRHTSSGAGLGDLAGTPVAEELRALVLAHVHSDVETVRGLVRSLARLESLYLEGCKVGEGIAGELAPGLRDLTLCAAPLGAEGARLLAARVSADLWRLDLERNAVGDDGAEALASAPFAPTLTRLRLAGNEIGPRGVAAIARRMPSLVLLDLCGNPIGDEGARLLAESQALSNVELLLLSNCGIGPDGARRLLDSPALERARRIAMTREVGPAIGEELRARRQEVVPLFLEDLS